MAEPTPAALTELAELVTKLASHDPLSEQYLLKTLLPAAPAQTLSGLAVLASNLSDEPLRILCLLLIRRLARQAVEERDPSALENHGKQTWDLLSDAERSLLQDKLLLRLQHAEQAKENERKVLCSTVAALEGLCTARGYQWTSLRNVLETLHAADLLAYREIAFLIYSECPAILADGQTSTVIQVFRAGLQDESPGARLAALTACVKLLLEIELDKSRLKAFAPLAEAMLNVLPQYVSARSGGERLSKALMELITLASSRVIVKTLFKSHIEALATFLRDIIQPTTMPSSPHFSSNAFDFEVRQSAIELQVSLTETIRVAKNGVVDAFAQTLLEVMTEIDDDDDWYQSEDISVADDEAMSAVAEQALERVAYASPKAVFDVLSTHALSMLKADRWQYRSAALSALGAIASACQASMLKDLDKITGIAIGMVDDSHPRVRNAAIYALSQMCTDLEGAVQEDHASQVVGALVKAMNDNVPRLRAIAAAACVNFLDMAALDAQGDGPHLVEVLFNALIGLIERDPLFIKENAIQALSLLADVYEARFATYYPRIMPFMLQLLETGTDESMRSIRRQALDCAATMGAAVPRDTFAPDAPRLLAIMQTMSQTVSEEDDETHRTLLASYAALADAVGPVQFAPFVTEVLPRLIEAAESKIEVVVGSSEDEFDDNEEEWDTVETADGVVAIKSGELEAKAEALSNLVIMVQAMKENLGLDALTKMLEVAVPLLKFYFYIEVREYAAALIDAAIESMSKLGMPDHQRANIATTVFDALSECIAQDTDAEVLAAFISCWTNVYSHVPASLCAASKTRYLDSLRQQIISRATVEGGKRGGRGLEDDGDVDDELSDEEDEQAEMADRAETESNLLTAANASIRTLMRAHPANFPLEPFLRFFGLLETDSEPWMQAFAQRLAADVVTSYTQSMSLVKELLAQILKNLQSADTEVLNSAAYFCSSAAQAAPSDYADFLSAAVEPLLILAQKPHEERDGDHRLANDAAIGAVSRIVMAFLDEPAFGNLADVLRSWLQCLPVRLNPSDGEAAFNLLVTLISKEHPAVSPSDKDVCRHIIEVIVSALDDAELLSLSEDLQRHLAQALKTYADHVDGIVLPQNIHEKASALLQ